MGKKKEKSKRNQKKLYRKDDTKTEFKSRKIKLNESVQLRNNATKMLLNKNLKVNTKLKLNAFEKMNVNLEIVNIENITGETTNGLAKYLLDDDNRIRSEFFKTVKNCFDRLKERNQSLLPYIQILFIYIKCGLTHIDQRIVKDSKKLLEYLIQFMDDNLNNHLVQVVNSRIKNNTIHMTLIDLELIHLVLKVVYKGENQVHKSDESKNFQWSTTNCTLIMDDEQTKLQNTESLNDEFEFNFSFPAISKEKDDEKEQFINNIREVVGKEILNRDFDKLTFTMREVQRMFYLLKISKILKIKLRINSLKNSVFISDKHVEKVKKDKLNLKQEIYTLLKWFKSNY